MIIHENIRNASTLPSQFYTDDASWEKSIPLIFQRTWHFIEDAHLATLPGMVYPFTLLEGILNEPLLLSCDASGQQHCLSNVCTHRGKILVEHPGQCKQMVCAYHGRKFDLDGTFKFMPEFSEVKNFPSACDNLHKLELKKWNNFFFTSLHPSISFEDWMEPITKRLSWVPFQEFRYAPEFSQDYLVNAHWALYCDNYLEGFHIPYVHPTLNEVIDYKNYTTELFPFSNLQLGIAKGGEMMFDIPEGEKDSGKRIGAYYFWLFPNLMLNVYPWGLSMNVIKPIHKRLTRVQFRTYIWKQELFDKGAAQMLERVEREDEHVVEQVQKGIRSAFYTQGRYSPEREQGVHHFHSLISTFLNA